MGGGRRAWVVIIGLSLYSCSDSSGEALKQPIQYNHNLHVQEQALACVDCHRYAATHARASIPNIEVCGECHSGEPATDSPEEAKLIEYVNAGEKIPWRKVYRVEDHIYFSHRRHTTLGAIECAACHGDVGSMTTPVEKAAVPITMDRCIDCHEKRGISVDCVTCHR